MPAARAGHRRQLLLLRQRPPDHRAATRTRRPARAASAGLVARPRLAISPATAMPRRSEIAASCYVFPGGGPPDAAFGFAPARSSRRTRIARTVMTSASSAIPAATRNPRAIPKASAWSVMDRCSAAACAAPQRAWRAAAAAGRTRLRMTRWAAAADRRRHAPGVVPHPGDQHSSCPEHPFQQPRRAAGPGQQGRDRHHAGEQPGGVPDGEPLLRIRAASCPSIPVACPTEWPDRVSHGHLRPARDIADVDRST
jgi:hypothetical protein